MSTWREWERARAVAQSISWKDGIEQDTGEVSGENWIQEHFRFEKTGIEVEGMVVGTAQALVEADVDIEIGDPVVRPSMKRRRSVGETDMVGHIPRVFTYVWWGRVWLK